MPLLRMWWYVAALNRGLRATTSTYLQLVWLTFRGDISMSPPVFSHESTMRLLMDTQTKTEG